LFFFKNEGVCYSLLPERLRFSITGWKSCATTSVHQFAAALRDALKRIDDLLRIPVDTARL